MEDYILYNLGINSIFVSLLNGNQVLLPKTTNISHEALPQIFHDNQMDNAIPIIDQYDPAFFKTIYISIHSSSQCNLHCKYCFVKKRISRDITLEEAHQFIDLIIGKFPKARKFVVDPSGSGEPLLRMDFIVALAEYCKQRSKEIGKEIIPMLVTNGTLLSNENVGRLQSVGYIFGVSVDGYKKSHNEGRVTKTQKGTYDAVMRNIKRIKHKEFLGAAVTLSSEKTNLVKAVRTLIKYFPTISIKPVRKTADSPSGICEKNIETIKRAYTKFNEFILLKTLHGNLDYLGALVNGDDYYGRFLLRVILNQKVASRCDAGLGRFSLTPDLRIMACPGSLGIDDLVVGSLDQGIDFIKVNKLWEMISGKKYCDGCEARFVCGGECMVESFYSSGNTSTVDRTMCALKSIFSFWQ
jgi:uncharacterized protein